MCVYIMEGERRNSHTMGHSVIVHLVLRTWSGKKTDRATVYYSMVAHGL